MLHQTFDILRVKTISLEYMQVPYWIKEHINGFFIMRYLNKAYEEEYLRPRNLSRKHYLNKLDKDIWGDKIGNQYHRHDLIVYKSRSEKFFKEYLETRNGKVERMFMKKYILDEETGREYIVGFRLDKLVP